jgi:hypothetical protein
MRIKAKPGDVAIKSGSGTTINLDQGSRDRCVWLRNTLKRSALNTDANSSVLVRRALTAYVQHIEALLFAGPSTRDAQTIERVCIANAARGHQEEIPEEELIAVPPKPYSQIDRAAYEARAEQGRQKIQQMLKGPPSSPQRYDDKGPIAEA